MPIDLSPGASSHRRRKAGVADDETVLGLHERALDNVAFVRGIMERSSHFTAVPGWGGVAMGLTALAAAPLAHRQTTAVGWLQVWVGEAVVAAAIALLSTALKARRNDVRLGAGPARRFAMCLLPALVAGAALTFAAAGAHAYTLLPSLWLLLYGTGVCAAGAVTSPPVVSLLGVTLIAGGVLASVSPPSWGVGYLALFFGAGHIVAGAIIARKYGG